MANPTFNIGMVPKRYADGREYDGAFVKMYVPSSYGTNVFVGDPVVRVGGSNSAVLTTAGGKYAAGTLPKVNLATLGTGNNIITGVIIGIEPTPSSVLSTTFAGANHYGTASTDRVVHVVMAENVLFHVRDDGGAALDSTCVGHNAVLIAGTGDTTATGISGVKMDAGTTTAPASGNATFQLRILALADIQNNALGANAVWEVKVNNYSDANIVVGV
jgi:hypothetical protein